MSFCWEYYIFLPKMLRFFLMMLNLNQFIFQEGLAAAFGNGLSTACVVNIGAQVTSVICIEVGFLVWTEVSIS